MTAVEKLLTVCERVLDALCTFFLCVCVFAVLAQVVMRYVFHNPTPWSDPLASDALAWLAFLGAAAAVRSDSNLSVRFAWKWLGPTARRVVAALCQLLVLASAALLFVSGLQLIQASIGTSVEGLDEHLSWAHLYAVVVVAALFMAVFSIERIIRPVGTPEE